MSRLQYSNTCWIVNGDLVTNHSHVYDILSVILFLVQQIATVRIVEENTSIVQANCNARPIDIVGAACHGNTHLRSEYVVLVWKSNLLDKFAKHFDLLRLWVACSQYHNLSAIADDERVICDCDEDSAEPWIVYDDKIFVWDIKKSDKNKEKYWNSPFIELNPKKLLTSSRFSTSDESWTSQDIVGFDWSLAS